MFYIYWIQFILIIKNDAEQITINYIIDKVSKAANSVAESASNCGYWNKVSEIYKELAQQELYDIN